MLLPFLAVPAGALLAADVPLAEDGDMQRREVVVTAPRSAAPAPQSSAVIDAARIAATVNAANAEDTLKYLPSLIVRKRHIGDTQAPLATRTSGLGSSARSLIYADGALLSALIGNNNSYASPRWSLVSPEEIARVEILYGPFAAAYPGNSAGAVVNLVTRDPQKLEATLSAGISVQPFALYQSKDTLAATQFAGTIGDRFGALSLFAAYDHVTSRSQPLTIVTAATPATTSAAGTLVTGGLDSTTRTGSAVRILGVSGLERQVQDRVKLKAAWQIAPGLTATYAGALFLNATDASAETYLRDASGTAVYSGTLNSNGRAYTVAASAFSGGVYRTDQRHWSNAVGLKGQGASLDWSLLATRYSYDRDVQRTPTVALPTALSGGAGTITRMDGTGWTTFDGVLHARTGGHVVSLGAHGDWERLESDRYATTDWRSGSEGAPNLIARGRTRTLAIWAEDAWTIAPPLTLAVGGRQEWWQATDGYNLSTSPAVSTLQPERRAARFSPKASLAWGVTGGVTIRASFGGAWRFPTVGELYQIVTTPVPAVPDPNLRPEHVQSEELAAEYRDGHGSARLSLFHEVVSDALVSQSGPLNGSATIATFVQNVDRTRATGIELAWDRRDLLPRFDLSGSLTYADARTVRDAALPAAEGKLLPSVPRWKATMMATWRPIDRLSLTAAARYASRMYGTIDNSDAVGNVWQGFYRYFVVDLRAQAKLNQHLTLGLGADNVGNAKYFLFHPFPQRTFRADLRWAL